MAIAASRLMGITEHAREHRKLYAIAGGWAVILIAVGAASKLLGREIDARAHADLLEQLAGQI